MSRDELEAYAKDAKLPDWFTQAVGVTQPPRESEENDG